MCRLYGFRASHATRAACALTGATDALQRQARCDRRGETHGDGWGLASADRQGWHVLRRATPVFDDSAFGEAAGRVCTRTLIAHVRQASVGPLKLENTHPFRWGRWLFAHNGTIPYLPSVASRMARELIATLEQSCEGDTDSERLFYWLLSRLARSGLDLDRGVREPGGLLRVVGDALMAVEAWCDEAEAAGTGGGEEAPVKLNIVLSDGDWLLASRWNHTLYRAEIAGARSCRVCGEVHAGEGGVAYRAVIVASEPTSDAPWRELPDRSVMCVNPDGYVSFRQLRA